MLVGHVIYHLSYLGNPCYLVLNLLYKQISLIQSLRYKHFFCHFNLSPLSFHHPYGIIVREKLDFVILPVV